MRDLMSSDWNYIVFIHRSNKTRIETQFYASMKITAIHVFIHRSNKTRIETDRGARGTGAVIGFYT